MSSRRTSTHARTLIWAKGSPIHLGIFFESLFECRSCGSFVDKTIRCFPSNRRLLKQNKRFAFQSRPCTIWIISLFIICISLISARQTFLLSAIQIYLLSGCFKGCHSWLVINLSCEFYFVFILCHKHTRYQEGENNMRRESCGFQLYLSINIARVHKNE